MFLMPSTLTHRTWAHRLHFGTLIYPSIGTVLAVRVVLGTEAVLSPQSIPLCKFTLVDFSDLQLSYLKISVIISTTNLSIK